MMPVLMMEEGYETHKLHEGVAPVDFGVPRPKYAHSINCGMWWPCSGIGLPKQFKDAMVSCIYQGTCCAIRLVDYGSDWERLMEETIYQQQILASYGVPIRGPDLRMFHS